MPRTSAPSSRRRYDEESGMNRVSRSKGKKQVVESSSSESYLSSDSELEKALEMPAKDDSRRKKAKQPKPASSSTKDGRSKFIKGEEEDTDILDAAKAKESNSEVAPHVLLLLGSVYHLGLSAISRPSVSSFLPWFGNAFHMLGEMCFLVSDNTLLHEMCPEFFSPAMYLYYSHVYYYQILRARAAAGSDVLTRIEKRVLTFYERVGQPEAWPIAAPMIGFVHGLGAHKPADPMYSWIVPSLPDFSILHDSDTPTVTNGLNNLNQLSGGQRIPLIPAYQKLLYNFANEIATFQDGQILPVGQPEANATHQFCGISASAVNSAAFQSLANNTCWIAPTETGNEFGIIDLGIKRKRLSRWRIPDVSDVSDLRSLQLFAGFQDGASFNWMNRLLSMSSIFNRFFPGSTTLAEVPTLTTLGMATLVQYEKTTPSHAHANVWYQWCRDHLQIHHIYGYSNTESGLLDTKRAVAISARAALQTSCTPALGRQLSMHVQGPFFNDGVLPERAANWLVESDVQMDPAIRFNELLTTYYDNKGGRS